MQGGLAFPWLAGIVLYGMTTDAHSFFVEHRNNADADQLSRALNPMDAAFLYGELNQLEGGMADPNRPAELASWKEWTVEDLIEYARTGRIPKSLRRVS